MCTTYLALILNPNQYAQLPQAYESSSLRNYKNTFEAGLKLKLNWIWWISILQE